MTKKFVRLNGLISIEQKKALEKEAVSEGVSESEIVRRVLSKHLKAK